jgi:hypothetical protein
MRVRNKGVTMKQYKHGEFTIVQVLTPQGDRWYNVFKGDVKINQTKELSTISKAKEFCKNHAKG